MSLLNLVRVSVVVVATACATATPVGQRPTGTPTEITAEQIAQANVATAYDVVDRLARRWFRDLSGNATGGVVVYLHTDQLLGGRETLRQIPASDVLQMRYLNSATATARYGSQAAGGAIVVTRR